MHLATGDHGYNSPSFRTHMNAVLGVDQVSYDNVKSLVAGLLADRGDVLAREMAEFAQPYDAAATEALARWVARDFYLSAKLADGSLDKIAEVVSELRIMDPLHYAELLATCGGIACVYADATHEEMADWYGENPGKDDQDKDAEALVDRRMVHRLGETALSMPQRAEDPAELLLVAGAAHLPRLRRILKANGVPFKATPFTPVPTPLGYLIRGLDTAGAWAYDQAGWLLDKVRVPVMLPAPPVIRRHEKLWLANAERFAAKQD